MTDAKGKADFNLSLKFGAALEEAVGLLNLMKDLGLTLEGFCFHCGTNLKDSTLISDAIKDITPLFEES